MRIPVLFMGGQYNHLIVRALKELGVDSKIMMPNTPMEALKDYDGLVMGGGPHSVNDGLDKFGSAPELIRLVPYPILGICLSHQLIGSILGGEVVKGKNPEYGKAVVKIIDADDIFLGVGNEIVAWASHNDEVKWKEKANFRILAKSEYCDVEALKHLNLPIYGVQFHIEVANTPKGADILRNFIMVCKK